MSQRAVRGVGDDRGADFVIPDDDLLVEAGTEQEVAATGELEVGDEVGVTLQRVRERASAHVPDEDVAEAGGDERRRLAVERRRHHCRLVLHAELVLAAVDVNHLHTCTHKCTCTCKCTIM